ncbi:HAD-superfamily hydrolase, subfamily IA, variant 1 [Halorubrum californiense DSM 19288]|uniref:HAD-superfamily hydrolase, subfamily IA, variant 1 n=1 Tax=Halorubrum californiense DSM 19288 TaxID=1227465 RepID=M0EHQ6_9EURY|nr:MULTISPECIES: HAD family hydrolase [Halorubrum]ELZ46427.1 HAD-superfamily hydrolase, subfamily IA, variant 1 [Halorubrum californiense DSM 19288]TKX70486.1 HAD family hydrolase [Halorubrum sp. GN11GM_10-3_MGM]
MSYEAVLFDLDNTLYPYAPCNEAGKRAALDALRERGYDLDRDAFDDLYATGRREAKRETRTTAASHDRHVYFKRGLYRHAGEPDAAAALAAGDAYWNGFLAAMSLCDGVEGVLDALDAAGTDVAVVTNLTTRVQLRKLVRLGLDDRIDLLVTSEEVGREKPSALPFTSALAELDCRPSEAVAVGDNVEADVAGANALGVDSALFVADGDAPAEGELDGDRRPDYRLDAFADLTEVAA